MATVRGSCDLGEQSCGSSGYCDTTCKARKPLGVACAFASECVVGLLCINKECAESPFSTDSVCMGYPFAP